MPTSADRRRPSPHLSIASVSVGYGGAPVVRDVTLTVGKGEIVAIVGPNGAGKSTLLKAVIGQLPVTGGEIHLGTAPVMNVRSDRLAALGLGYVPQLRDTFPTLSVLENLEMGGYLLPRGEVKGRIDHVLEIFPQLAPLRARTASKLSGGERKMLAIGRALMLSPTVLVLDEPTANLSPLLVQEVLEGQVRAVAASGAGVLLVEQRVKAALSVSDWGYVLVGGSVRLSASAADLEAYGEVAELFFGLAAPDATCVPPAM